MQRLISLPNLALAAALLVSLVGTVHAEAKNVCLILYMVADNNLEAFLASDILELLGSDGISQPTLNTWIYFDPHGGMYDYDQDGLPESPFFDENRPMIFTYDHTEQDLVYKFGFEEVSSSDDPSVLCSFLQIALAGCVEKGANEYVLAFSGHGGGHAGFGGDDNIFRRRHLLQSNADAVSGIQCGLDGVEGAPNQLDLIGFDTCLMSSFQAVEVFSPMTKYILASEATEPGHGWYWNLPVTGVESALAMGTELMSSYISETQNPLDAGKHLTPKTLSLIDTSSGFPNFLESFETFVDELRTVLFAGTDQDFFVSIQRTRNNAMAFASAEDNPGSQFLTAVDIGSFLTVFGELCGPDPSSDLADALEDAVAAYDAQFVARDVGVGTRPATGMAVFFPSKQSASIEGLLRLTNYPWLNFILQYLVSKTPAEANGESVCTKTFRSDIEPTFDGQLFLNPGLTNNDANVLVSSEITPGTSYVWTTYGHSLDGGSKRRRLLDVATEYIDSLRSPRYFNAQLQLIEGMTSKNNVRRRRLDEDKTEVEYLIIFNGDVVPNYNGPAYSGVWNKIVYSIGIDIFKTDTYVYTAAHGDGVMAIPVLFFPYLWYQPINSVSLPFASSVEEALALGAYFATLQFTVDEVTGEVISPVSLYQNAFPGDDPGPSPIFQVPESAQGYIVPIVQIEVGRGAGRAFLQVAGDIHRWDDQNFGVLSLDADTYASYMDLDSVVFDMYALNVDLNVTEVGGFDYVRFNRPLEQTLNPAPSPSQTEAPTDAPARKPTNEPTAGPIPSPTESPTNAPTKQATNNPTDAPFPSPRKSPTNAPTKQATNNPTADPIPSPTESPTNAPTKQATNDPTVEVSKDSIDNPTTAPSPSPMDAVPDWLASLAELFGSSEELPNPTKSPTPSVSWADPTNNPTKGTLPTKSPSDTSVMDLTNNPVENATSQSPTKSPNDVIVAELADNVTDAPSSTTSYIDVEVPVVGPTNSSIKNAMSQSPTKSPTNVVVTELADNLTDVLSSTTSSIDVDVRGVSASFKRRAVSCLTTVLAVSLFVVGW